MRKLVCHIRSSSPQLNGPASFAAGESNASVVPTLTPSAPSPAQTDRGAKPKKSAHDFGRFLDPELVVGGGEYAYFF